MTSRVRRCPRPAKWLSGPTRVDPDATNETRPSEKGLKGMLRRHREIEEAPEPGIAKSDPEWREELSPEQFAVLRQCGTEPAFTGKYWDCHDDGMYHCAACGAELFASDTKFESGTGWPSFTEPAVAD